MRTFIYAHRGSSGEAPENTLAAFRLAAEQGADGIELDIQMSLDGQLVVIHDETLNRTTDQKGYVGYQTYAQIARADASYRFKQYKGERVPLLSQVLDFVAPTNLLLNIELKNSVLPYPGMEETVIRLVQEYHMEERVVFSSFNHYSIAKLVNLAPQIESATLYSAMMYKPWEYAISIGARALHPHYHHVNRDIVNGTHAAGLSIRPYTVNREGDIRRMLHLGVDAIITNYPAQVSRMLIQPMGE